MFQLIKTQVEGIGEAQTDCQLPDVAEYLGEDYQHTVPLSSANVSSVERIDPVHSETRDRWGHIKSWKKIPDSTRHSGKWVTTSNVSGVRTH